MRIRTETICKHPVLLDQFFCTPQQIGGALIEQSYRREIGATIIEYVLLVAVIGLSITFVLVIFEPQSKQFHDSNTTGRQTSYPTNFIPEPTPTVAATATPG
jgi:Flp pilus assembly pilin Flp